MEGIVDDWIDDRFKDDDKVVIEYVETIEGVDEEEDDADKFDDGTVIGRSIVGLVVE